MLCTAIAVRTCSTWYGVIANDTGVSSMKYSIVEYFNGWLADADRSSNAGPASAQRSQFVSSHANLKILTAHPPEHDSSGRPTLFVCLNLMFVNVCYV